MQKTYVYIIKAGNYIKVGVAKNVQSRMDTMQTGNHLWLEIIASMPFETRKAAFDYEAHLHHKLKAHKVRGEWFVAAGLGVALQSSMGNLNAKKREKSKPVAVDSRWVQA